MSWDFETEPEFQKELDWIEKFVREEVEPLEFVLDCHPYDVRNPKAQRARAAAPGRSQKAQAVGLPPRVRSSAARATARSSSD